MNDDVFEVTPLVPEVPYSDFARDSRGALYFAPYDLLYLRFFDLDKNLIYTAYMLPNETVESAVRRAHRRVHLAFALCFILTVVGGLYSGVITESNAGYLLLGYEPIRCLAPWFLKSHLDKLPTTSSVVRPTPSQQRAHSTRGWTGVGSLVFFLGAAFTGLKSLASPSLGSVLGFAAFGFLFVWSYRTYRQNLN